LPKIGPIDPYKLIKILNKIGFKPVRQRGSHIILMNEQRTRIVIPVHSDKEIKPGLVRIIIREAELTREKYFELLKRDC